MASANVSITRDNGTSINLSGTIPDELAGQIAHAVTEAVTTNINGPATGITP